jgi:hypothetical protein
MLEDVRKRGKRFEVSKRKDCGYIEKIGNVSSVNQCKTETLLEER